MNQKVCLALLALTVLLAGCTMSFGDGSEEINYTAALEKQFPGASFSIGAPTDGQDSIFLRDCESGGMPDKVVVVKERSGNESLAFFSGEEALCLLTHLNPCETKSNCGVKDSCIEGVCEYGYCDFSQKKCSPLEADGCCPVLCSQSEDMDCALEHPACVSGVDCDDSNPCTVDSCKKDEIGFTYCENVRIISCIGGDNCCPQGCAYAQDNDCEAPPEPMQPTANEMFSCDSDSECALVVNSYCDDASSINKSVKEWWDSTIAQRRAENGVTYCGEAPYLKGFEAYCYQGKCAKKTEIESKPTVNYPSPTPPSQTPTPAQQPEPVDPYALTTANPFELIMEEKAAFFEGVNDFAGKKLRLMLSSTCYPGAGCSSDCVSVIVSETVSGQTISVYSSSSVQGGQTTLMCGNDSTNAIYAPGANKETLIIGKKFVVVPGSLTSQSAKLSWTSFSG